MRRSANQSINQKLEYYFKKVVVCVIMLFSTGEVEKLHGSLVFVSWELEHAKMAF